MAFNISEIQSRLRGGGARPNLFEVHITNPVQSAFDTDLSFLCRAAQMPASSIGTLEVPYFGRKVKLAGDRTFAEWTVTIMNEENMSIRNAMELWSNKINGHVSNIRGLAPGSILASESGYKSDATVTHFAKHGGPNRAYRFVGLWPSEISPIDLDWSTTDTLEEYTVTFQYDLWTSSGTDTVSGGGPSLTASASVAIGVGG